MDVMASLPYVMSKEVHFTFPAFFSKPLTLWSNQIKHEKTQTEWYPTKYLTPQNCQRQEKEEKIQKLSQIKGDPKDTWGLTDWILKRKMNM